MIDCATPAVGASAKQGKASTESPLRRLVACGMGTASSLGRRNRDPTVSLTPSPTKPGTAAAPSKRLNLVSTLLGNCGVMCVPGNLASLRGGAGGSGANVASSHQFAELHGLRFIGLGAVVDELTPRERVYDTLEQLTTRTARMVSVGYLLDVPAVLAENRYQRTGPLKITEALPLDVWTTNYPDSMSEEVARIIADTQNARHQALVDRFSRALARQMAHPDRGSNKYLAGITAHNLGVVHVLAGRPEEAVAYFREAISLKTAAFGRDSPEVALSCDELGIQLFAKGDFEGALVCFEEAHAVRSRLPDAARRPLRAMVLNNLACCHFQLGDHRKALALLQEADNIQQRAIGSSAQADLDLLHVAIVVCNCGYLMLALKMYDEARSLFEEALLIQQSVLDDGHRAIRDTLSNLEFANAFHM